MLRGRIVIGAALSGCGLGLGVWALVASSAAAFPLTRAPNCPIFPKTNVWNARVDGLPRAANSARWIVTIGSSTGLHPDFGSYAGYGIPFNVVPGTQPKKRVRFQYASESDPGPYPIPRHPRIEAGSDRHLLIVDRSRCRLYEMFAARHTSTGWHAGSGAIWDLGSNHLRPDGWTSADAAGLPILPGLVRWNEIKRGVIDHALRFTAPETCSGHIYPARHDASSRSNCGRYPPMGLRVRLRKSFPVAGLPRQARIIAVALKRYGMILADNGSSWYISGASNPHFNDDALHKLDRITGADLVVVDTSHLRNG